MKYFDELQATLAKLDPTPLLNFVRACQGTLWLAGNGGSASTAQHWACDLSKAAFRRVQALGSNPAVLTAWANDQHYYEALASELGQLYQPNDAVIALSCSGESGNIQVLIERAIDHGLATALVTSSIHRARFWWPGTVVQVPHTHYGIIEDCHLAIGHWLTEELQK